MGPKKGLFGRLLPAIAVIVASINLSFGEFCGSEMVLRVTANFYERSVTFASSYAKTVEQSYNFQRTYEKFSMDMSVEGGFKGLSVAASMAMEKVKDETTWSSTNSTTIESEQTSFNPNFLQIMRQVTTELSIDGESTTVVEETFVHAIPIGEDYSSEELTTLGEEYIAYKFGSSDDLDEDEEIVGSTYTKTMCTGSI